MGIPVETAPVLARCQLPVRVWRASGDRGQTYALCVLPCQRNAEPGEPFHLAPQGHGRYALALPLPGTPFQGGP